jgi:hypothetical protein
LELRGYPTDDSFLCLSGKTLAKLEKATSGVGKAVVMKMIIILILKVNSTFAELDRSLAAYQQRIVQNLVMIIFWGASF